jgi:CubicO group peptidase (beta-lactamase class C family)
MKTFKQISLIIVSIVIWAVFLFYGATNGFILRSISSNNSPEAFIKATKEKIDNEFVGNLAMVLVEDGQVAGKYFHSIDSEVDENTVFLMASVSKWVTSWGILALVDHGKLDLDRPVDDYLTRWHLPESEFNNRKVTVRRLLSHTSGFDDDLGYDGFGPDEYVQTLEESLTNASDGYYEEAKAKVGYEPGSQYMYSGAGYTLLQLLIEEVSGQSFQEYMTTAIFEPLEMTSSTFVLSAKPDLNLATFYDQDGSISKPVTFTALAAASLYTSAADLTKFLIANISQNNVLSLEAINQMSQPESFINNTPVYGLGPHLYSQGNEGSNVIGHDGSGGTPRVNTAARVDLVSKNGIIIMEMGSPNIASNMADEWLFEKAGIADFVVITRNMNYLISLFAIGVVVIVILAVFIIRKRKTSVQNS